MRITRALIEQRMEFYEKKYGFDRRDGWNQIKKDLKPVPEASITLPRAVAYGAYMALHDLLGGVMHIADIDGRIYERTKREAKHVWQFAACWCFFLLAIVLLIGVLL